MDGVTINISWEYALGIIGFLIAGPVTIAWYTNGRFTALETSLTYLRDELTRVWARMDANRQGLVQTNSPTTITPKGEAALTASGLKTFIDEHKEEMKSKCFGPEKTPTAYDVQTAALQCASDWDFGADVETQIKEQAFKDGVNTEALRFAAGIYLRDVILKDLNYSLVDIDKTDPNKAPINQTTETTS